MRAALLSLVEALEGSEPEGVLDAYAAACEALGLKPTGLGGWVERLSPMLVGWRRGVRGKPEGSSMTEPRKRGVARMLTRDGRTMTIAAWADDEVTERQKTGPAPKGETGEAED